MSKNERRLLAWEDAEWYSQDHSWSDTSYVSPIRHLESPNIPGFAACRENSLPINSDLISDSDPPEMFKCKNCLKILQKAKKVHS